jgi:hypothetical protein
MITYTVVSAYLADFNSIDLRLVFFARCLLTRSQSVYLLAS